MTFTGVFRWTGFTLNCPLNYVQNSCSRKLLSSCMNCEIIWINWTIYRISALIEDMNRSCLNHEVPVFMKLVCLLGCCADNHECSCIVILHVGSIRNQPCANNAHDLCCFCLLGEYFSLLMKRSFRKTNVSHSERRRVSPFSRFIASDFLA